MLRYHMKQLASSPRFKRFDQHFTAIQNLVLQDARISALLEKFGATPRDIRDLFEWLLRGGANIWVHGTHVAASSVANPIIVCAYLKDRHKRRDTAFQHMFADTCVRYVEGGYTDEFLLDMFAMSARFYKQASNKKPPREPQSARAAAAE